MALLAIAFAVPAVHSAMAGTGALRNALSALELPREEMHLVEQYAERAVVMPQAGHYVAWTSRNTIWHAQAVGDWIRSSRDGQVCRTVKVVAIIGSQDGPYRREVSAPICMPAVNRTGQYSIATDDLARP
ncbi:MAG: hypothetical protein HYR63_00820 [Proteobacteria bacterium]|nr:hypothetical protein [Pseudomonadota bacterium]